jgi:hypothetical protein
VCGSTHNHFFELQFALLVAGKPIEMDADADHGSVWLGHFAPVISAGAVGTVEATNGFAFQGSAAALLAGALAGGLAAFSTAPIPFDVQRLC